MKFTKMHGLGNNYIYVNLFEETIKDPAKFSIKVSDKNFGIGSDGLITIGPSDKADFFMRIYNADGSEAQMCGNGIRCVAKYVYDNGLTDKTTFTVETLAGIKTIDVEVQDKKVVRATVDMGAPILRPELIPVTYEGDDMISQPVYVDGTEYLVTAVSMGNPHAVIFMDDVKNLDIKKIGPKFEHHDIFPERTNTEFIRVINRGEIEMRVWERGSDETFACGTGACASTVACILNNKTDDTVLVHLLGGDLTVTYDREKNTVIMTGPATTVCTGEIEE